MLSEKNILSSYLFFLWHQNDMDQEDVNEFQKEMIHDIVESNKVLNVYNMINLHLYELFRQESSLLCDNSGNFNPVRMSD